MVSSKANIFQDTAIGKLPIEWDVKLIGEVCNILDSKRVPLNKENRDKIKEIYHIMVRMVLLII